MYKTQESNMSIYFEEMDRCFERNELYLYSDDVIVNNNIVFKPKNNDELYDAVHNYVTNKENVLHLYGNINDWDVSNVTCMSYMFENYNNFNEDISNWDVGNVEDMSYMFYGCKEFNSPLKKWNISKVKNMSFMFYGCKDLQEDLSNWCVNKEVDISGMFMCSNIEENNKPVIV